MCWCSLRTGTFFFQDFSLFEDANKSHYAKIFFGKRNCYANIFLGIIVQIATVFIIYQIVFLINQK